MVVVVAAARVLGMVVLVVMMFSTDEKTLCWWTINLLPTEQLAGFNPSSMAFGDQPRPSPMFSEEGRTSQGQAGLFSMGPQKEMASFFDQLPTGGGIIESNNVSKFHCKCSLTSPNILWHVRMYERICLHIAKNDVQANSTSDECYHVVKIDFNICETDKWAIRMLMMK